MNAQQLAALFIAAALAGAVNSVAGGGTLLTFPTLFGVLHNSLVANATSTVALWPGQLSSLWGYRKEIGKSHDAILRLAIPSLLGGGLGAYLLLRTPQTTFSNIVPYLILTATALFMTQESLSRYLKNKERSSPKNEPSDSALQSNRSADDDAPRSWAGVMLFQFFVAIYGGYFGAGIGILMLAALGFMGFTNIHRMNGLKNINGLCINAVAIAIFIFGRTRPGDGVGMYHNQMIHWPLAALMTAGSILGGYSGAGIARRIGQRNVRRVIIGIGIGFTLYLLLKR